MHVHGSIQVIQAILLKAIELPVVSINVEVHLHLNVAILTLDGNSISQVGGEEGGLV